MTRLEIDVGRGNVDSYDYAAWFAPRRSHDRHELVEASLAFSDNCGIADHYYWQVAAQSREALVMWVTQELIVTGPFSQCVLRLASLVDNVHLRSMVMAVAHGEHGRVRGGMARNSHPWLLHRLRESMGIPEAAVQPLEETQDFLRYLRNAVQDPLTGVAVVGVGNERLILPEYGAAKKCFALCWPDSDYSSFLDANIDEDLRHSELLADVGSAMIADGGDADAYYHAAVEAVQERTRYYDRLLARFRD